MTLDEIRAIEEYCTRATEEKWIAVQEPAAGRARILFKPTETLLGEFILNDAAQNSEFVVRARSDLPRVVEALKRAVSAEANLRVEVDSLRHKLQSMRDTRNTTNAYYTTVALTLRDIGRIVDEFRKSHGVPKEPGERP